MRKNNNTLLHLSLIPQVGPVTIKRLMSACSARELPLEVLYDMSCVDLERWGLTLPQAQHIIDGLSHKHPLDTEIELIEKHQIALVTVGDAGYPRLLQEIHAPPAVLYVHGSSALLTDERMVAVVGSRQANTYGRSAIEELLQPIIEQHWTVVSGGARGIDAAAHHMVLKQHGTTVAVLGSGLLNPYPREHGSLFREIVERGGTVVSPFPLRMTAVPSNFPARNRIISGMSRACIVIQAAEKSGALITAVQSLQEGRDVGAVPGSIFDALSAGCHHLIREGATPIASVGDVKAFLGIEDRTGMAVQVPAKQVQDEDPIIQACRIEPRTFDDLMACTNSASPDILYSRLWDLQVEGKITQTITGQWEVT